MKRLLANSSRTFSVNKYYRDLRSRGLKVSRDLLYELLDHLVEAYAVFMLPKWDASLVKREQSMKKSYAVDPGLVTATTYLTSRDLGDLLETVVYLELAKREKEVLYFHTQSSECDFVVVGHSGESLVQVCYELTPDSRARELKGLAAAARCLGLKEGAIITHAQQDVVVVDGLAVRVVPAWRWALENAVS